MVSLIKYVSAVKDKVSAENIVKKTLSKMVEIGEVRNLLLSFKNCSIPDEDLNKILKLLSKSKIKAMWITLRKRKWKKKRSWFKLSGF